MSITINILQPDTLGCTQLKRERFRMNIRKNNLENIFRQNRFIHKVGDKTSTIGTVESLLRFLKTNDSEDLDMFCNLIDSMDIFEAQKQVSDQILDIKFYLTQPQIQEQHFKKMFILLSNCINVNPNTSKQLLYDEKEIFDPTFIFRIIQILSSAEWKSLHTIALDVLGLLIVQENQIFDLLKEEKGLIENLVFWAYDFGEKNYLLNLAEFLSIYLPKFRKITFNNQEQITIELLQKAHEINELKLTYGMILLSLQLNDMAFFKITALINSLLFQVMTCFISKECSTFDYVAIFKLLRKCFKKSPYVMFSQMPDLKSDILKSRMQEIDKHAGKECLKLIGRCYETFQCMLENFSFQNSVEKEELSPLLISDLESFLDLIMDFQISAVRKVKPITQVISCLKFLHFELHEIKDLSPGQIIKYLDIFILALEEKQQSADTLLFIIEWLGSFIIFEDDFLKEFQKLFPKKLKELLYDLLSHENEKIVEEIGLLSVDLYY